ncbi:MAG: KAP family NTPase [Fibrobacterales bacterium]
MSNKFNRVVKLYGLFVDGDGIVNKEYALKELNCSENTFKRLLAELRNSGMPIEYDRTTKMFQCDPAELHRFELPASDAGEKIFNHLQQVRVNHPTSDSMKVFAAGSTWGEVNKASEFFKMGVWESGYQEKYADVIRSAQPGDVIILKSTYATKNTGYLRVKGVGHVIRNLGDGKMLEVDWIVINKKIDIPELSKYRNTFGLITGADPKIILNSLREYGIDLKDNFTFSIKKKETETYAKLDSDSYDGPDLLGLSADYKAFSKIIVASDFRPPLAIALFGNWGAGKSFFMKKIEEQIGIYSMEKGDSPYCKGVAHIGFNAWSYLDTNLWAGIITTIFEGLDKYINDNSGSEKYKTGVKNELIKNLNFTNEEYERLKYEKSILTSRTGKLEELKKQLEDDLSKKNKEIGVNTLTNAYAKVNEEFDLDQRFDEIRNEYQLPTLKKEDLKFFIAKNGIKGITSLSSKMIAFNGLFSAVFRWQVLSGLIVGAIILGAYWLCLIVMSKFEISTIFNNLSTNLLLPIFGAVSGYLASIKKILPWVTFLWRLKNDHKNKLNEEKDKWLQISQSTELERVALSDQISRVEFDMVNIKLENEKLSHTLENTLTTEALKLFIAQKANGAGYSQYLGLVSLIRKDLNILSELFLESDKEVNFLKNMDKPLERIVLYIDDLDRCPENRVVEVLEAVNLLMAFPLFVVVVGVDQRWVEKSLDFHHKPINENRCQCSTNDDQKDVVISAKNYLEKIFQVPFHLKAANEQSVKKMVDDLCYSSITLGEKINDNGSDYFSSDETQNSTRFFDQEDMVQDSKSIPFDALNHPQMEKITSIILSDFEINMLKDFTFLIGKNPRAVKRFINTYRIIRTHEDIQAINNDKEVLYTSIMLLLALPIGRFDRFVASLGEFINVGNGTFYEYFESIEDIGMVSDAQDIRIFFERDRYRETILNAQVNDLKDLAVIVSRFTFQNVFQESF